MQQKDKPEQDSAWDDDRLLSLVDSALGEPPSEREAYLRRECAGDAELFEQAHDYVHSEERMGGFLLEPLWTPELFDPALEPGKLIEGRFRIERQIGEGGMGVVYEAWDEKLGRRIAIKIAKAGFGNRLPPEVRHATEIGHPNVCKIFEIHKVETDWGEIDFITMEYLEGQTLKDRLHDGPLSEREARGIARQLCAGLAAAHRSQVVHRDLKSNNIILTKEADGRLRAVITDFGLAHRGEGASFQPAGASSGGSGGTLGGAPDYMAPELWQGEKASVASDIYALGCICYEMLSGTRLRQPGWPSQEPPAPKLPRVHRRWDGILACCLEPDPARRYRTVEEIEKALAPRSRHWMLASAASVVLAAITGVVTYRSLLVPPESIRLAVLPFETSAADKPLGDRLRDQTADQLRRVKNTRTRRLTVIPLDAALRNKLDRPEDALKLPGATHVLYVTLRHDGVRTLIHAYLADAHPQVSLNEMQAGYEPNELRDVPVALAGIVTGTLHLPPPAVSEPVNAAAFTDFTKGSALLKLNHADEAIPLLENAGRSDPGSPLIHARLARAQITKYASTNETKWLEGALSSLHDARQRNPDVAEVWSVSGLVNYYLGLYQEAESNLHRALEIEPNDGDAWRSLGRVYQNSNRFSEAFDAYQKAIQWQPSYFQNYQDFCSLLDDAHFAAASWEANYKEAIVQCTKMITLAPDSMDSYVARAIPYFDWGHFPEAETDLRTALRLDPNSTKAIQLLASSVAYQGNYKEAIALFRRAIRIGPETPRLFLSLGQTLRWAGHPDEARKAYRRGVVLARGELTKDSRDKIVQAYFAYMLARLDQRVEAQTAAVLAMHPTPAATEVSRWVVMTYEALGQYDQALAVAETAPDVALRNLNRSPDMAGLRSNPRFQQLIQSRHIQ